MGGAKIAHAGIAAATKATPSVVKELCIGFSLGIVGASFWKMHHVNEKRKIEEFYAALEAGSIQLEK
ncbi:hypothetical protein O6H91_01G134500 [Diphasiastrum complanatum]|uniref:Uncharacterized protein n=1 Tax=Diphasiastrum complanatum TaxID=34168 RepID=A0ACC2EW95_DIPCM|nr:hypothetical protein O6H91_Y041800 [Diphasiastrum complanatum]KAJ7570769.1 hypothetical protein O6H91_01G134500 [Diphasiastrum complanatum]